MLLLITEGGQQLQFFDKAHIEQWACDNPGVGFSAGPSNDIDKLKYAVPKKFGLVPRYKKQGQSLNFSGFNPIR